jgi:hypothetical protein
VLEEKEGALTAHVRFTVLLLPGGSLKVTGLDCPPYIKSSKTLPEKLLAIRQSVAYVKPEKKEKAAAAESTSSPMAVE